MSSGLESLNAMRMSTGNCPDVALSLASCCPAMEVESSTNSSEPTHPKALRAKMGDSAAENEDRARDSNEDVGSAMTEEESTSPPALGKSVSFLDLSRSGSGLERMGSGMSVISAGSALLDGDNNNSNNYKLGMGEQGKLPSSQYKGVVPQPNGRWGAQIYEKHQRVWLGTFNREEDAAKAYDRAALKFRGRDAITNFVPVSEHDPEALFLSDHSKGEIVDMLRKHTYDEEFDQSQKMATKPFAPPENPPNDIFFSNSSDAKVAGSRPAEPHEHLFDKAVTPSDVGKLNRLVIPKQHAEKYFPLDVNTSGKGLLLNFEDNTGKMWRFRYSYWNSSQSYVLTKGWSRFVKEKKLNAGDIVSFYRGSRQLFITWRRRASADPSKGGLGFNSAVKCFNLFAAPEHPGRRGVESLGYPGRMHLFWSPSGNSDALKPVNSSAVPRVSIPQMAVPKMWSRAPVSVDSSAFCSNQLTNPAYGRNSSADFVKQAAGGCLSNSAENKTSSPSNSVISKSSVMLFGVNLASAPIISMEAEYTTPSSLLLGETSPDRDDEHFESGKKRKASLLLLSSLFSIDVQGNCIEGSNKLQSRGLDRTL